jgi:hypothetical protein
MSNNFVGTNLCAVPPPHIPPPPLIKIGLTNPPKYGEDLSLLPLVRTSPHVLIPSSGTSTSSLHTFFSKSFLFLTYIMSFLRSYSYCMTKYVACKYFCSQILATSISRFYSDFKQFQKNSKNNLIYIKFRYSERAIEI